MILVATIHDPQKKLANEIQQIAPKIKEIFAAIYLCVSDQTDGQILIECQETFANVKVIQKNGAADARRKVLKYALEECSMRQSIMYCDFDRVLTWIKNEFEEIQTVVSENDKKLVDDYVVLGRTEKAFATHPNAWRETEKITNKVASYFLGTEGIDVTAGAAIFSFESGKKIANLSKHTHTDCEWPLIVKNDFGTIGEIDVDGLSYEHVNETNISVSEAAEYYGRLKLSEKILAVFFE